MEPRPGRFIDPRSDFDEGALPSEQVFSRDDFTTQDDIYETDEESPPPCCDRGGNRDGSEHGQRLEGPMAKKVIPTKCDQIQTLAICIIRMNT